MLDSARRYPDGLSASLLRARRAAQSGDAAGAAQALKRAADLGFDSFFALENESALQGMRQDPRVRAAIGEIAGHWIEIARSRGYSTQHELQLWAQAHSLRGEWAEAITVLERALAQPGAPEPELRRALAEARRQLAREGGVAPPDSPR
jgi:tetratricopeptide (TPR) repeat protein